MLRFIISHSFSDNIWFFSFRCLFLILFIALIIGLLLYLYKNQIGSMNATRLIKIQTIFDIATIVVLPLFQFQEDFSNSYFNIYYLYFYCLVFTIIELKEIVFQSVTTNSTGTTKICKYNFSITVNMITYFFMYIIPFLMLLIFNIMPSIVLLKNIKNKITRNSNLKPLCRRNMFVRFSVANFISSAFFGVFILWTFLLVIIHWNISISAEKLFYYFSHFNSIITVVNPIVYIILFKKVRQFFVCF